MKKTFLTLSLLIMFGLPAISSNKEIAEDYFDMAQDYYKIGQITSALDYANQVLKINPEHFGAKYLVIKLTPPNTNMLVNNLSVRLIPISENSITSNLISDKLNQDGQKYYNEKDYKKAEVYFCKALKEFPQNRYALNNLGLTYIQQKEFRKAEKCFKKASEINLSYTVPLDNLGQMYIDLKEFDKANSILKLAIFRNKNDYCANYLLGLSYKYQRRYSDANIQFNDVIQKKSDFALAYLQLADTYYYSKDYNWSNTSIENYLNLCPKDDYAYYILSRNYKDLKDYNIAKNYIVKAIYMNNCQEYRAELANIEDLMGNTKEAINMLKMIKTPSGEILNLIGNYYAKLNNFKQALDYYKKASAEQKSRPIYLYNQALMCMFLGNVEDYNKIINTIESIHPITTQDYVDLSAIFIDCTDKNKTISLLDKGIRISPKNKNLYEAKNRIYTLTKDNVGLQKNTEKMNKEF